MMAAIIYSFQFCAVRNLIIQALSFGNKISFFADLSAMLHLFFPVAELINETDTKKVIF